MMTKRTGYLAVIMAALLAAAMPLSAGAQAPGQVGAPSKAATSKGGGGGGGKPAARAAPRRAAAPHRAPRRAAAPHRAPKRAAAPRYKAPAAKRTVQKHQIKRAQSHRQAKPARKAVQRKPQIQQQQKRAHQRQHQKRVQPSTAVTQQQQQQIQQRATTRQRGTRTRRAQQRQQTQPNAAARANAPAAPNALTRRARRDHRAGRVSAQAARRGRFAAQFGAPAQVSANQRARRHHYEARRAWRHGLRAPFVPWYGPVFWPYAYSDIFDYTFWPHGYEPGFWAYTYDGFIDSLFWGERGPPDEYVEYAAPPPPRPSYRSVRQLCKQPGSGITAWPFAEIERKVHLDGEQKRLLAEVRAAAKQAASVFKASCPSENAFPLTPPGRLRAMMARLDATLEAVQTVRPALEAFYNSLSDEQKERFNAIGPKGRTSAEASQALPQGAQACAEAKPGLTNLPIDYIDGVVKPNDAQQHALDRLGEATVKAVSILQAACPQDTPLTPPGRLEVMETRLQAMIDAANTVKPALDGFYGSLSSEQKARFNRIGRELANSKS